MAQRNFEQLLTHCYLFLCRWGRNSVVTAWDLSLYFPDKLHLERNTFCRPNYQELNLLYREMMDWSSNYIVHLYSR